MSAALRIVFAGTPEFAVPALEALAGSEHYVRAVYTQPDRPAGRGQHLAMSPVKQCASKHGFDVEQPATLRDVAVLQKLAQWGADVMVVVAYGLILPREALAIPRLGCINIHASLLPRWRGAAPIQRAILAGDAESGVAIMRMEAGLDTGPVLLERRTPLDARETASSLHDRLAAAGADALIEALVGLSDGSITPQAQAAEGVTYAAKINKQEALIDWTQAAHVIDRKVRAFNPWPVAETRWAGQQLRVWEAAPESGTHHAPPGTVIGADSAGIRVATGEGILNLMRVQLAGRKPMAAAEFINAQRLDGAVFGMP